MRSFYAILLVLTLAIAGVFWYRSTEAICPAPLSYSIGNISSDFDLSVEEAKSYLTTAETIWESEIDRELFVYDESSNFKVDFIFDERQAMADSEAVQKELLDQKRIESEEVLVTVDKLKRDYKKLTSAYDEDVDDYEDRLRKYNAEVNKYNDRGGAPPDVFEDLEEEREELSDYSEDLNKTASDLNKLVKEINALGDRGNRLVEIYNQDVLNYNDNYGFEREFTQGDYERKSINVYKFSSDNELITVLAHEFGHALGLQHVEGESSLMYYLLGDTSDTPILSSLDLNAFYEVCGTSETTGQKVRRIIRGWL